MAAHYMPKTLARTITYIAWHAPGEYGLFWDPKGTMPWKELYWALQEDPSLRFVKEFHLKELAYLGLELPFELEGALLQIRSGSDTPSYPVSEPPERLYHAIPRKRYIHTTRYGLSPDGNRSYLPLAREREVAVRLGKRRDPNPVLLEVSAGKASRSGVSIRMVDSGFYLAEHVPIEYLVIPKIAEENLPIPASGRKQEKASAPEHGPVHPGSFFLGMDGFQEGASRGDPGKPGKDKKGKRGSTWKDNARELRKKRNL